MTSRHTIPMATVLALGAAAGALFGGCGGATKTVTASEAALPTATTGAATAARTTTSTSTSTSPKPTTTTGGTGQGTTGRGAGATRTAPAPAFTRQGSGSVRATGETTAAAVAVVKTHGYTPDNTSDYHPSQTLRVLVGTRTGSSDGYDQQAFFFVDGRYIGTDSSRPSASVRVVSQSDTEVVLAYPLYRPHDPLCCPGGGQATVRFQLDNGKLVPLNPIPPAASQTGTSRQ